MPSPSAKLREDVMTWDTLYGWANGRTPRGDFIKALGPLVLAAAFYIFIAKSGRNGEGGRATLLYPGFVLVARRLHDMGQTGWLLIVPGVLDAAGLWLHFFDLNHPLTQPVCIAAAVISAAFVVWGLVGKGQASPNR